jgi:hypothetical protein
VILMVPSFSESFSICFDAFSRFSSVQQSVKLCPPLISRASQSSLLRDSELPNWPGNFVTFLFSQAPQTPK